MLSEKDKDFIHYWEKERERLSSISAKLIAGLPVAILFCLPILLFITSIYLFFSEWYTKVSNNIEGAMSTIIIAIVIFILFFSYFRIQYKWELNEQHYLELKQKENI